MTIFLLFWFAQVLKVSHLSSQFYQGRVRDLLDVLQACVRSSPSLLGSTVWGQTDIHRKLGSITTAQKERPQTLYFVKVRICFNFFFFYYLTGPV